MNYGSEIEKVLLTGKQIEIRTQELADEINRDYADKELLVVCILRGGVIFMADLFKRLTVDAEMDFLAVSSYGAGTTSSGEVKVMKDLSAPVDRKHILVIEDIIDTGITLSYIMEMLSARKPSSIKLCSLLDKPSRRKVDLFGDYVGFEIPNEFVVGYGLDYDEKFRNLPDVCVLSPSVYEKNN
ncbi:MAG: hypoxanthine phosphoribosyltransferase [Clostridia bacterium]|nr:hypoxanthine phosphoribosyltransferase [Clostridia bacterium]